LKAGISIAHEDVTAGTLGWYCEKDDRLLVLSNNHVLANENKGDKGDPILQPGPHDGGQKPEDVCGELFDFVPIRFSHYSCPWRRAFAKIGRFVTRKRAEPNLVDLALCKPSADVEKEIFASEGEKPLVVRGKRDPEVGETVKKSGRTTCLTEDGEVKMTKWRGTVTYSRGMAEYKDQILVKARGFSAGGDSGSAVLDEENNFVGLLFAGSKTSTIANKMSNVEKVGDVEVITR